jgi:hypothetical protein
MRRPFPTRRLARWAALAAVGLGGVGCEALRTATQSVPAATGDRTAAVPKKPGGVHPPLRVSKFVFYADVPLEANDALFRELEELPEQIQKELQLPSGNTVIQVYLFDDQDRYEAFMRDRFPWLPVRRAYFIGDQKRSGAGGDLQVYTWMGEHLRTDLRHELTHALLHEVLKSVPLWLDEGLAGFFEQPPAHDGVNPEHLDRLRKEWQPPDLARLEKIGQVGDMGKAEYREAWAWVHYLLRGDPKARTCLLNYLQGLRGEPGPGPFLPRLREAVGDADTAFAGYVGKLDLPVRARAAAAGRVE